MRVIRVQIDDLIASEQNNEQTWNKFNPYEVFTSLKKTQVFDWPLLMLINKTLSKKNIDKNTTFVMTIDDEIISSITAAYSWEALKQLQLSLFREACDKNRKV